MKKERNISLLLHWQVGKSQRRRRRIWSFLRICNGLLIMVFGVDDEDMEQVQYFVDAENYNLPVREKCFIRSA